MNLSEAMREAESHGFAARLNLASDLKTFLRAAKREESVLVLLDEMTSPDKRALVLSRVMQISQSRVDRRYENPGDVALAIYVWIMTFADLDFAKVAAQATEQVSKCWWARQIADQLLSAGHIHTTAGVLEVSARRQLAISSDWSSLATGTIPGVQCVSSWQTVMRYIDEGSFAGVTPVGQSVAPMNFVCTVQEGSSAGEMILSSGFLGLTTSIVSASVSASLYAGSPGSVNTETGWLGRARPPYTIENPLQRAA